MLPTLLRFEGFRLFFYSNEGSEPHHVHVEKNGNMAKLWLSPVAIEYSHGFNQREITKLTRVVEENRELLITKWNEYFGTCV